MERAEPDGGSSNAPAAESPERDRNAGDTLVTPQDTAVRHRAGNAAGKYGTCNAADAQCRYGTCNAAGTAGEHGARHAIGQNPETPAPPEDPPKEPVENEAFDSEIGAITVRRRFLARFRQLFAWKTRVWYFIL